MLRKMSVIILLILTALWVTNSDSIRPAREFIQNNIYVWSETQEEKLPIYCVDTDKKQIALTFDTAWGNEDIPQILKILKQENVKATFFFCGDWISKYPADIKTIYEEGHDIASHGDRHKYMTKLTDKQQQEEIRGVTEKIQGLLGIKIDLFRAPYGDYNESVVKNARRMNYYIIQWNVDSLDWQEPTKEQLIKKVCEHKNLSPGSIILMRILIIRTKKLQKRSLKRFRLLTIRLSMNVSVELQDRAARATAVMVVQPADRISGAVSVDSAAMAVVMAVMAASSRISRTSIRMRIP